MAGTRRWGEGVWFGLSFCYAGLRIALANATVAQFGVDIRVFAAVELLSTVPYALGVSRAVRKLARRESGGAAGWMLLAAGGFLAPEAYIALTANDPPLRVYLALMALVVAAGTIALVSLRRQVKRKAVELAPCGEP